MQTLQAWLPALPNLLLALAALVVPGGVVAWALGLRGRLFVGAVPLISVGLGSLLPLICTPLGVRWGWGAMLVGTTVLAASSLAVRAARSASRGARIAREVTVDNPTGRLSMALPRIPAPALIGLIAVGPVLACLIGAFGMMVGMGSPGSPAQTFDAVFHLNAVEWIHQTGDGSSLNLWAVSSTDRLHGFYPGAWHDMVVLAYTGEAIVATNSMTLIVSAFLWPLGLAMLGTQLFGNRPVVWILAPIVATMYNTMPEGMASWGTLYANLFAYTLIPWLMAAFLHCTQRETNDRWRSFVVVLLGGAGLSLAHPNASIGFAIFAIIPLLIHVVDFLRGKTADGPQWKVFVFFASGMVAWGWWLVMQTPRYAWMLEYARHVSPTSLKDQIIDLVSDTPVHFLRNGGTDVDYLHGALAPTVWVFPVLLAIGLIVALATRGLRWMPLPAAMALYLTLSVSTESIPPTTYTGLWYNDSTRLGTLFVLLTSPLVLLGAAWLTRMLALLLGRITALPTGVAPTAAVITAIALLAGFSGTYNYAISVKQITAYYDWENAEDPLVTGPEMDMMRRVAEELPEGAKVIGDPYSGASLLYAVAGVESVYLGVNNEHIDDQIHVASEFFPDMNVRPDICQILNERGVDYYYSDSVTFWKGKQQNMGLYRMVSEGVALADQMKLVDEGGTARVFELTPCEGK